MMDPMKPPRRMDPHEKMKLRAAAFRLARLGLPPAISELLSKEILVWEDLGYWLGTPSLVRRAVDEIMKWPYPDASESKSGKVGARAGAVGYD
jgi:hypothetical protein